ncbi:unnamed protein product [Clonostachys rosea]|uniref:Heterokaryon incompatibility domain-containing protein n=1 Tax=Bionectria ochroleuca TaxID=29856 RepID=A0ABY6TXA2_BIOOC|nr:unnamed protein product [Clonostachys rosea]
MRILKTHEYKLLESKDIPDPFPPYAILSHTWISPKEEITYQDFKTKKEDIDNGVYKQMGWAKVKDYCDRAAKDGWEWAWMDTCCIDKTNPADTQEAINAMFRWYQKAGICYARLDDVDAYKSIDEAQLTDVERPEDGDLDETTGFNSILNNKQAHDAIGRSLVKSKWFTRGWTLQELLAPHYLVFLDQRWHRIGTRESWSAEIKEACRIEPEHLTTFKPTDFTTCSIAMRLSWASSRETTVEEDETYSLIGLFGISLPLIYGEGRWRAFNRLQRELILVYNDDSIFAWTSSQSIQGLSNPQKQVNGILAPSIREFKSASQIQCFGYHDHIFSMTNRGLETNAKCWNCPSDHSKFLIQLNCGNEPSVHKGIFLRYSPNGSYERTNDEQLVDMKRPDLRTWTSIRERKPILIRSGNLSGCQTASIFVLRYPEEVSLHATYFTDFGAAVLGTRLKLLDEPAATSPFQTEQDEILVQVNQLTFTKVDIQTRDCYFMLDIVIYVNENGFPSVGIRKPERWGRTLGDPLGDSSRDYQGLAGDLYDILNSGGYLPSFVAMENDTTLSVHLLPNPPKRRPVDKSLELREYTLRVNICKSRTKGAEDSEQLSKRRKVR